MNPKDVWNYFRRIKESTKRLTPKEKREYVETKISKALSWDLENATIIEIPKDKTHFLSGVLEEHLLETVKTCYYSYTNGFIVILVPKRK